MSPPSQSAPTANLRHAGNFGAARLLLAIAVIFGHTPELLDGNRSREPLTMLFHGLSLGETAVFGFFLLSGYLLTASILAAPDLVGYAVKRIARIYPGFILATLICFFVVAPLTGAILAPNYLSRTAMLLPLASEGAFAGSRYPALNGALWTIHHEACCYVVLAMLSLSGLLRRPTVMVAITSVVFGLAYLSDRLDPGIRAAHPDILHFPHLLSAFLTGSCARLLIYPARPGGWTVFLATGILGIALAFRILPEQAVILAGGYVLFWLCECRDTPVFGRIGRATDLSYGIYLYAWPVQSLLIWQYGFRDLSLISLTTVAIVTCAALFSWHFVEHPAMRAGLKLIGTRRRIRRPAPLAKAAGVP